MRSSFPAKLGMAVLSILLLTSCTTGSPDTHGSSSGEQMRDDDSALRVYATTGYLADAAANIAPDAEITTMVGPGGDPHTYQPSTRDIQAIQDADVVLWNGLHLEAQMADQLESLGDKQLAVGDRLPKHYLIALPETDGDGNSLYDPHVWNSPEAWSLVVNEVAVKLGEIGAANADDYSTNAQGYIGEIETAFIEAEGLLASIPMQSRVLITGHDAFNYFGEAFELEVYATDFVSTEAALSPHGLSDLATLIADRRVSVIFRDNQANPQAITSLKEAVTALGWQIEVSSDELYADSLGAEPGVDTYLGALRHNAEAIAEALRPKT